MATITGNNLTSLVINDELERRTENGREISRMGHINESERNSFPISFGEAHPDDASLTVKEIVLRGKGTILDVEIIYRKSSGGDQADVEGDVVQSADANAIEVPIENHANYDGAPGAPSVNGNAKPGVESYLVPAPVYTRESIEKDFEWTEDNIILNVGTRNAPTGVENPTANAWLKVARGIRQVGDTDARLTESWQYAPDLWDPDIYS